MAKYCFLMKRNRLVVVIVCLLVLLPLSVMGKEGVVAPATIDSLLTAFGQTKKEGKVTIGRQIISSCMADDQLIHLNREIDRNLPTDTLHFLVWLAAERFYYNNGYFKESLALIEQALPLADGNSPEYHATLLCDRGYCLYKTGRNAEATESELDAEKFSRKHGLMQPLARSYNYQAIINISLGMTDEAKYFVEKAIETDRLTGSNQNTHNYLGIACEVYTVAKEPDKAVDYGHQAVEAARAIGYDAGVANHLCQLSYAYNRKGDFERSLAIAREVVHMVEQMEVVDRNLLALTLENEAYTLIDMKRNSEAVPVLRRAIALQEEIGNFRSACYDYFSLGDALEPNNPHEANRALRRYATMLDSLHHAEMHEALSNANAAFHNDELQEANAESRRHMRLVIFGSALGILLLLAIIAVLGYINRLRKRTQEATRRLQADRETFFTNVTHEFRTPLTVILGLAQRLSAVEEDHGKKESLAAIERNGQSLLHLVNQLLDISKVTAFNSQLAWQEGDVVTYIEMIVERFRPMAEMRGVELRFHRPLGQKSTYFVADYMQKMVGNLLSNALKFTPQGGVVTVKVDNADEAMRVSVADTGVGIRPEDLGHVFEPFYQGANQTYTGTGVGLTLVSQLAKALGGKVEVSSTPGEQTVFTITLPFKDTLSGNDRLADAEEPIDTQLSPSLVPISLDKQPETPSEDQIGDDTRTRVLVVEDNHDVAYYIGSVLHDEYDVIYASDGRQGLEMTRQQMPDLIVTDIMMPDVDGLQLCQQIRSDELTNHIPIIILTARATDADRLTGLSAGADAYLLKPFLAEELQLRVAKLLEQRHLLQQKYLQTQQTEEDKTAESSITAEKNVYEQHVMVANEQFLSKLDGIIFRLMPQGTCDATTVAQELAISRQQLGRKLKAVADVTPSEYIVSRRLDEAKRLLLEQPPLTLLDIALRCGFADHSHLTHTFRRKFGMTPTQYVKSIRG